MIWCPCHVVSCAIYLCQELSQRCQRQWRLSFHLDRGARTLAPGHPWTLAPGPLCCGLAPHPGRPTRPTLRPFAPCVSAIRWTSNGHHRSSVAAGDQPCSATIHIYRWRADHMAGRKAWNCCASLGQNEAGILAVQDYWSMLCEVSI